MRSGAGIHVLRDRPAPIRVADPCSARAGGPPRRYAASGPSPKEEIVPSYRAPVEEVMFLLTDVLDVARYDNLPGFADAAPDLVLAVLREAAKLCEEVTQPLNRSGDQEGCARHHDGSVTTPKGFKEAYRHYVDGGWMGISAPPEFGGQGLPGVVAMAIHEFMNGANMAFAMYPGLTQGALATILIHGTMPQKALYLPAMVAGRWTGTMNLTEPQCGTDLGLLRTKAVKQADGSYRITGTKIFISAGEHDLAENIVHLVLARIEGAPAGIRGLSLFIVPKILPDPDGALGVRNAVACGAIEAKMGIHGNATCVMNYDGATGWLVGAENRGINAMFTMMNQARLGVGVQGLGLSEVAYQNAAAYAKERLQGRAPSGAQFPDQPADPLVVHPDVRAMLLTMRAFNEAARALVMWTALQGDVAQRARRAGVTAGGRGSHGAPHPGDQSHADRSGFRQCGAGAADFRRARLHRRARHGAVRARCAHRHALRGRQRHPGARSGRPQARPGRRPGATGFHGRGRGLHQAARPGGDAALCRPAGERAW